MTSPKMSSDTQLIETMSDDDDLETSNAQCDKSDRNRTLVDSVVAEKALVDSVVAEKGLEDSDDELKSEDLLDAASKFKQAGNELYKRKEYEKAVEMWFTSLKKVVDAGKPSLKKDAGKATSLKKLLDNNMEQSLYLNLAQGHLMMQEYERAIRACEVVLHSDPDNEKTLYREAEALYHKGDMHKCKDRLQQLEKNGTTT